MMTYNEILELIKAVNRTSLTEFKVKDKDFELHIKTKNYSKPAPVLPPTQIMPIAPSVMPATVTPQAHAATPAPTTAPAPAPATKNDVPTTKSVKEVKSPIVGTFYRASGPDKAPFVKVGDTIKKGDVVCIIEAMKLFNEIESDVDGTIVKVLIEDASPVEYDQVLFLVE